MGKTLGFSSRKPNNGMQTDGASRHRSTIAGKGTEDGKTVEQTDWRICLGRA
jgi:hypothetical protein